MALPIIIISFCVSKQPFFCKEKKALAFNRDRYCHQVLCLQLIILHIMLLWFSYSYAGRHSGQCWVSWRPYRVKRPSLFVRGGSDDEEKGKKVLWVSIIDIESLQNRLLKVCYVPASSASLPRVSFFFSFLFLLLRPLTVLMQQTRWLKQSIFLDVYGFHPSNKTSAVCFTFLSRGFDVLTKKKNSFILFFLMKFWRNLKNFLRSSLRQRCLIKKVVVSF
jgi:hypothetical protein